MADSFVELPDKKPFVNQLQGSNGFSEHYGALHVASLYCGVDLHSLPFRAVWQHGFFGPWTAVTPKLLTYSVPDGSSKKIFVARKDQEELLLNNGYARVKAIGLPIVYVQETKIPRRKGSLLVVPIHTLEGVPFSSTRELDDYADMIQGLAKDFTEVVACVHPGCKTHGYWFKQFSERGIEVVEGADSRDSNALLRMKMLFEQFEFVTTNGWGSHVAYALYSGAKLSIHGPAPARDINAMLLTDSAWGGDINEINKHLSDEVVSERHKWLGKFYLAPKDGIQDIELGRWFVGADNKLSPEELKKLFGWSLYEHLSYHGSLIARKVLTMLKS